MHGKSKGRWTWVQRQRRQKSGRQQIFHLASSIGGFLKDRSEKRPSVRPRLYFTSPSAASVQCPVCTFFIVRLTVVGNPWMDWTSSAVKTLDRLPRLS